MSSTDSGEESHAVILAAGLVVVVGLLFSSLLAIGGSPWLGIFVGLVELMVAWRVTLPVRATILRGLTGVFGAFTVAWSVLWLIAR